MKVKPTQFTHSKRFAYAFGFALLGGFIFLFATDDETRKSLNEVSGIITAFITMFGGVIVAYLTVSNVREMKEKQTAMQINGNDKGEEDAT